MGILANISNSVERYNKHVENQVELARLDKDARQKILQRWRDVKASVSNVTTPTGIKLPRLALPNIDEPGEIARYLYGEGLPGEFPFLNGAYREMYLEPIREIESFEKNGEPPQRSARPPLPQAEEPTRLFSGLMLAEDTNERFH